MPNRALCVSPNGCQRTSPIISQDMPIISWVSDVCFMPVWLIILYFRFDVWHCPHQVPSHNNFAYINSLNSSFYWSDDILLHILLLLASPLLLLLSFLFLLLLHLLTSLLMFTLLCYYQFDVDSFSGFEIICEMMINIQWFLQDILSSSDFTLLCYFQLLISIINRRRSYWPHLVKTYCCCYWCCCCEPENIHHIKCSLFVKWWIRNCWYWLPF